MVNIISFIWPNPVKNKFLRSLFSDYSVVKSGVRMLIDCKKPLFSTPDVFEIYSNGSSIETTESSTTDLLTTDSPTDGITTTYSPIDQLSYFESLGCQFHENDHGATFDTGSPYSNDLRQGLRNSQLKHHFL